MSWLLLISISVNKQVIFKLPAKSKEHCEKLAIDVAKNWNNYSVKALCMEISK